MKTTRGFRLGLALAAVATLALMPTTSQSASPAPGSIEVVAVGDQPWYTAEDRAVAREIASPRNSRARQLSIADIIIPAGVAVKPHYHKVIEEIYYVTGGRGIMTINGVDRPVGVGDAIVIRPGERHSVRNETRDELRLIVTCSPAWTPDCLLFD